MLIDTNMFRYFSSFFCFFLLFSFQKATAFQAIISGTAQGLNAKEVRLSCTAWVEDMVTPLDAQNHFAFIVNFDYSSMFTLKYGTGIQMLKTELFLFGDLTVEAELVSEAGSERMFLRIPDRRCNAFKTAKNYMDDLWINKSTQEAERIIPHIKAISYIGEDVTTDIFAKTEMLSFLYSMEKEYGYKSEKSIFEREEFVGLPINSASYMGFAGYKEVMVAYNQLRIKQALTQQGKNPQSFANLIQFTDSMMQGKPSALRFEMALQLVKKFKFNDLPIGEDKVYLTTLSKLINDYPTNEEISQLELMLVDILNSPINRAAPDFTLKTPDGQAVSLTDLNKSFVLIDVWGSWCRPCRVRNKELVELYNTIVNYSMDIALVSIAKEESPESWKEAIAADGLIWTQLRADEAFIKNYEITEFPTMILINKEGKIIKISKDISLNDLITIMY